MSGLEWSAVTLASHVALVLSVIFTFWNAIWVQVTDGYRAMGFKVSDLQDPIIAAAIALVTERCYYITARLTVNSSADLWEAHPLPELLSFSLAASIFWLAMSILFKGGRPDRARLYLVAGETITIVLVGVLLIKGLW